MQVMNIYTYKILSMQDMRNYCIIIVVVVVVVVVVDVDVSSVG